MIFKASDIAEKLKSRAEEVCRYLLPAGKMLSGNWCVGGVDGQEGKSLKIQITGSNRGIWSDFATGDAKGDLLNLWAIVRGKGLGVACQEAREWLGEKSPVPVMSKKWAKPPDRLKGVNINRRQKAFAYLAEKRKIPDQILMAYRVGQRDDTHMVFPSFSPAGNVVNVKYIGFERDEKGKKNIFQEPDCPPSLFGWQALEQTDNLREIIITEGQIDAMTWKTWGFQALSVPHGTGDDGWVDYEWDNLIQFDSIWLSFDEDEAGQEAVLRIAKRLGTHRCLIVRFPKPHKDANDWLMAGMTWEEAGKLISSARPLAPIEIKTLGDFKSDILDLNDPNRDRPGLFVPLFGDRMRFRPGETTAWTGATSHGKSTFLNQLMIHSINAGQRAVIASFEMKPKQTLNKLVKCLLLRDVIIEPELDRAIDWAAGRLWIYDIVGQITTEKLFDLMLYSRHRHDAKHFVVDSLMKCQVAGDDYEAQRNFVNRLCTFASDNDVHIHMVAHPRKGQDDAKTVDISDIKGSSDIGNQVDNVITVFRNREKEEVNNGMGVFGKGDPDAVVAIKKQRETGDEFRVELWFMKQFNRFCYKSRIEELVIEDFGVLLKEPAQELNL